MTGYDDKPMPLMEVADGALHIRPHNGQEAVLESDKRIVLVLAGNQSGKCIKTGSMVASASGKRIPIENIVKNDDVLSIDDNFRIVHARVNQVIDSGVLPVYEVVTTSGRRIEVSETHPFLSKDGWKEIKDFHVKDFVAVPRNMPIEGTETHGKNELLDYLRDIEMMGHTAHTKHIPEFVFGLTNECIATVINRLFACDGWVDTKGIGYGTVSKRLMYDVQHLLLRFGIVSRVRHRYTTCNGKKLPSYAMEIARKSDMIRFQKHIGIFSKDTKLAALIESKKTEVPNDLVPYNTDVLYTNIKRVGNSNHVQREDKKKYELLRGSRKNNIERHKLGVIADEFDDTYLKTLANSDIFWDQVKSIEYIGDHQCYDLDIEGAHNFIANDIFVHNTSIGAIWMYNQILDWDRRVQEGKEHLARDICFWAVISSYPLLNEKLLPVFRDFFIRILQIGEYHIQAKVITVRIDREDDTSAEYEIHFKSAKDPDSLASATVAAMYVDECAMPVYTYNVWTELNARLTATRGKRLYTSTIYKGNYAYSWIKRKVYDRWKAGADEIDVFRFESKDNPFADKEELRTAREILPPWEYDMRYRGIYTKPVGSVYAAFDEEKHVIKPFPIPITTRRWGGIDPGVVNHATVWIAEIQPEEPEYQYFPLADGIRSVFVVYRTALTGSTTTTVSFGEQAEMLAAYADTPFINGWCGGARSEKYFRADYREAGIIVNEPPFTEVDAGISAVYALMMTDRFYVFADQDQLLTNPDAREDRSILSYSRKIDDEGNVLDEIEHKEKYHLLDGIRYCILGMGINQVQTATSFMSITGKSITDYI